MNERIQELHQQAKDYINEVSDDYGTYQGKEYMEAVREKFAELIVEECIKESMEEIVSDDEIAQENDPLFREFLKGNNQGIVDAVVRFRNHFGVKE